MKLTVLGAAASFAGPGQACSGYLIEAGDTAVMLDLGNGTVANAAAFVDVTTLAAVFVSHTHADHFLDLYALQAALRFAPEGPAGSVPAYLPEGLWERMGALLPESGRVHLAEAFEPRAIVAGEPVGVGPLRLTAMPVDHDGPSYGFRIEEGDTRIVYTSDTRDGDTVRALIADGCDVLVAECTLPAAYVGRAAHLTAAEAGGLARLAGAGLLVLTHLWPTADHDAMLAEAGEASGGEVVLARAGMEIEIGPGSADLDEEND